MFGPVQAVIFDLDGTLVNTMPSVTEGLGLAIEKITGKRPPADELLKTFGPAPQDVLRLWMPEDRVSEALKIWLEYEQTEGSSKRQAFAGIPEMLQELYRGQVKMGLFTGRDRESAVEILKTHGWWNKYFSENLSVCGDDGLPTKPQPDGILHLLNKLQVPATKVLMVGDHPHDMRSAKAAGVRAGAALWDVPSTEKTPRANFKRIWESWNSHDIDVRLVSPGSLLEWVRQVAF